MRITINIVGSVARIVVDDDDCEAEVHRHPDRLDRILQEMKSMTEAVDRLKADITTLTSVEQSAVQLLAGLSQTIRDNATDPAALNAIADDLEARTSDLAAAVTANTPAAADTSGAGATATTDTGSTGTGATGADAGAVAGDGGTADAGNVSDTTGGDTSGGAAAAGATDDSGTAAIDPTVDAGAGEQATQDQADPPA